MHVVWLLGNVVIAEATVPQLVRVHADMRVRYHEAFFCPRCGNLWARMATDDPNSEWSVNSRPCRECKRESDSEYMPAGSLSLPWDEEYERTMPPELLRYECLLHEADGADGAWIPGRNLYFQPGEVGGNNPPLFPPINRRALP